MKGRRDEGDTARGRRARARETARRVLEEYHRKARQMGRNIDTVTRRGNRKEIVTEGEGRCGGARGEGGLTG